MASRIHRPGERFVAEEICWRHAGEPELAARHIAVSRHAEPASLTAEAAAEFERRVNDVRAAAFEEGRAAGRAQAMQEVETAVTRLAHSIEAIAGMKARLREQAEQEVVALALAVARRVLHRQVQADQEALHGLVKAAVERAGTREVTEVRVHPSFLERVRRTLGSIGAPEAIHVRADASLEAGGVIVETSCGSLDASIDTQLDEIGRGFADTLATGGTHARVLV